MHLVHAPGGLRVIRGKPQLVAHPDPLQYKDPILDFDLAFGLGRETVRRRPNLARFQRATKGSRQSTGRRRDHVVQSRRVFHSRRPVVVRSHGAMDTETNGSLVGRDPSIAIGPFALLDADSRSIDDLSHGYSLSQHVSC